MLKLKGILFFLFSSMSVTAQNITRLEIKSLPSYHPSGAYIYAAGSFNGWNPQDEKYKFQHDKKGNYFLNINVPAGQYEFKITRGSWDNVECNEGGTAIANRILKEEDSKTVEIIIKEWADRFPGKPKASTASKSVHIIDTAFLIPQLKRVRRIWIYLPEDYAGTKYHYPVLYMQDGQNIFDEATSYSGEWGVDEFLDSTTLKSCIVVAIDNGGVKRMNEYNPYDNERFGKGEGNLYIDFIVKTVKPFIDKNYKTASDKENTFIAGSSMGGLISMYAILKYPGIFGGAAIFSPSFWIAPGIYNEIKKRGKKVNASIYFYAGKEEGEAMLSNMLKAMEEMTKVSASKIKTIIRDEGKHNEMAWRKEFPLFYEWVIEKK